MGGARVTTLVTLRKCTLGHKREIKTLRFVSASTKGFKGGFAWIKPSKKDMAVTFSYYGCMPNMCICIPPSKTQRRHKPNARHIIHTRMGSRKPAGDL